MFDWPDPGGRVVMAVAEVVLAVGVAVLALSVLLVLGRFCRELDDEQRGRA